MIRALDCNAGNAAEEAVGHQLALDFVPDLGKTGVEFLSNLLLFHGRMVRPCEHAHAPRRPAETQRRRMARRLRASDEETAAIPMPHAARSAHRNPPSGMKRPVE